MLPDMPLNILSQSLEPDDDNKTALLEKLSKNRKHQWKLYTFKIVNGTHLKYFKSGVRSSLHAYTAFLSLITISLFTSHTFVCNGLFLLLVSGKEATRWNSSLSSEGCFGSGEWRREILLWGTLHKQRAPMDAECILWSECLVKGVQCHSLVLSLKLCTFCPENSGKSVHVWTFLLWLSIIPWLHIFTKVPLMCTFI